MSFADRAVAYYRSLDSHWEVPDEIRILRPYDEAPILDLVAQVFHRYFDDDAIRIGVFGINPGRFGAGRTGVAFTDPIRLKSELGIANDLPRRPELSSAFVYEAIRAFGGPTLFFRSFFLTALCPLGFVKDGKNFNFCDDPALFEQVEPRIVESLEAQIALGLTRRVAICLGKGRNFEHFQQLNARHRHFERIEPLPHPRWVLQYRRRQKSRFLDQYVECLRGAESDLAGNRD